MLIFKFLPRKNIVPFKKKTSLEGHFLRKTVKRKIIKLSYSIGQIYYWICSNVVFVEQNAEYYSGILQIRQWNKSNSKVNKYYS